MSDSYHHRWRFLSPSQEPGRRTFSTVVLRLEAPAVVRPPGSEEEAFVYLCENCLLKRALRLVPQLLLPMCA